MGDVRALTLDHIYGNGKNHREKYGLKSGRETYQWIKNNHFPEGFQVLCRNCQQIKRIENNEWRKT